MAAQRTARPSAASLLHQPHSGAASADAQESVAACIESYVQPTADIATQPPAYSTKIVSTTSATIATGNVIQRRNRNTHSSSNSSTTRTAARRNATASAAVSKRLTTTVRSSSSSNQASSILSLTQKRTQPSTVSLTGPRQPPPPNTIAQQQLRESTHSDTAEYLKQATTTSRETIRMVWPADSALYDWSHDSWDGQPIPIDDLDHVFDPLDHYSIPPTLPPAQQPYPTPEQNQVLWSSEEQATMDRLIEDAIDEPFEGFDLDELDGLLGEESRAGPPAEDEPLAEFFPMLGSSTSLMPSHGAMAPSTSAFLSPSSSLTPPLYHDMTSFDAPSTSVYHHQTTTTTTMHYGTLGTGMGCGVIGGPDGEWVKMGAPDGRIDRSPTFMDTGCNLNAYLDDWYDEPSTSRSSPESDDAQLQLQHYQQPQMAMTATRRTTAAVRYAPYASPAPSARSRTPAAAKRPPVFRPEGFGTPALGENVDEYRKRRDKNNISSARSRAKKADALKEMKAEAVQLEKKNIELKAVLESLEREVTYYKELMMTALSK